MVIILIVFLTLVSGMCASIIVSCWGKIQERRRRKLEYHMRKSREASMEGQMNKVDQMYDSNDGSNGGAPTRPITGAASNSLKQRLTAPIAPSENHSAQQHYGTNYSYGPGPFDPIADRPQSFNEGLDIERQRQLLASGDPLGQHAAAHIMQQQQQLNRHNTIIGDNYGRTFENGHANPAIAQQQQQLIGASNPNLNANFRMMQQQPRQPSDLQERSMSVYGSRSKVSDFDNQSSLCKSMIDNARNQSSLPGPSRLAQVHSNSSVARPMIPIDVSLDSDQQFVQCSQGSPDAQKFRDHLAQQQQKHPAYLASLNMYNDSLDSSSCRTAKGVGHYFQGQQRASVMSQQQSLSSTMPKIKNTDQQPIFLDSQQQQLLPENYVYNQRRALTLSTMHRRFGNNQMIYGNKPQTMQQNTLQTGIYDLQQGQASRLAGNNLSSSITCCNAPNETPLISDLVKRANMQQQQHVNNRLMHLAQANNAMRIQQQISDATPATTVIPRSISAHQLSKSQLRLNQQQQQLQRQHQQLLQQRHQAQSAYVKSMSDAGQASKHHLPNHSLSYPHACSGAHAGDSANSMAANDSPALPPPPPPPNLAQRRNQVSCSTLPPQVSDNKRQAFKVSRLDPSQLTGDTLPDSDLVMTNMPLGSMQFDDVSTESDATFGMLIDSVGNASLNFGPQMNRQTNAPIPNQQAQHPLLLSQSYKTIQSVPHLSDCNLIRRQRAETLASTGGSIGRQQMLMSQSSCICDCGALESANNQLRQQQEQALLGQQFAPLLTQQRQVPVQADARDFDMDSDEMKAMQGVSYGFTGDMNDNNSIVMTAQLRPGRQIMHMNNGNIVHYNGTAHGNPSNQQQMRLDRFRQQSSELTADDEEDVEDDDDDDDDDPDGLDGFVVDSHGQQQLDIDDDEISSDIAGSQRRRADNSKSLSKYDTNKGTPKSIVRRNEEELRDVGNISVGKKQMSGSHTSICTCGSQAKLDLNDLVDEDDDDEDSDHNDDEGVPSLNDQKMSSIRAAAKSVPSTNDDTSSQPSHLSNAVNEVSTRQTSGGKQDPAKATERDQQS
jgi:hypothetical protein